MASHFRRECEHGKLITQCRCPSLGKRVEVQRPCPFGCAAPLLRASIRRRGTDPRLPWVWQVYRVDGGAQTVLTGGARESHAAAVLAAGTYLLLERRAVMGPLRGR